MSLKCTTTVPEISLELLATVTVTISESRANRLLIPQPLRDFPSHHFVCTSRIVA